MQEDFHYYATYTAAVIAGYSHEESLVIAYSANFVDCCTATFLASVKAPVSAATTQTNAELADARSDLQGLQNITRIWGSFHFLPYDLYANPGKKNIWYKHKYRLICNTNGPLLLETIRLVKGKGLAAAGLAMHVLADTWAHRYFAGTPSMVINNTDAHFFEVIDEGDGYSTRPIRFIHKPGAKDDLENASFINSVYQMSENSIMNLGHGRAGHLPDYSYIRYKYLPAWNEYKEILKDNPSDHLHAFAQMVYALKYLKGDYENFERERYDWEGISSYRGQIDAIFAKRQPDDSADWKALGEEISGMEIPAFDINKYKDEYKSAGPDQKDETYIGKFIMAALAQKSMVTGQIFNSGNPLAGISVDPDKNGLKGIPAYFKLIEYNVKNEEIELFDSDDPAE